MPLACNLANFGRSLSLPEPDRAGSLTRLREKLVKIDLRIVRHGRHAVFQLAEVTVPRAFGRDPAPDPYTAVVEVNAQGVGWLAWASSVIRDIRRAAVG